MLPTKDLWKAYRAVANENPFVRVVKEQRGIYRVPEPKILAGSNYADLGFELDESNGHIVSMCAIDNLMKGASGSAVQCMNLMMGWDETTWVGVCGVASDLTVFESDVRSNLNYRFVVHLRQDRRWKL